MKIQTAVALLALTAPAAAGAAVLQDSASAQGMTHTVHWVLYETASHNLRHGDFVGTDRITSATTGHTVGFDSITGHFTRHTGTVQAAFALRGGIIVVKVDLINGGPRFRVNIVTATGAYAGA